MQKVLLSLVAGVVHTGYGNAQTTLADFEGAVSYQYPFVGSLFPVVENPSKTGINTSNKVAMTQKASSGAEAWGGAAFPLVGTINFAAGAQAFTLDDTLYKRISKSEVEQKGGSGVYDHPYYRLLNLSVCGNLVGFLALGATYPQTM